MSAPNNRQGSSQSSEDDILWEEQSRLMDQLLISYETDNSGSGSSSGANVAVLPTREDFMVNGLESLTSPDAGPFEDCVICQDPISVAPEEAPEHPVRIVGCGHIFHDDCLQPWLTGNEVSEVITCPLYRFRLFENENYAVYIPPEEFEDSEDSESDFSDLDPDMPPFEGADPTMPLSAEQVANIQRIVALEDALEDQASDDQPAADAETASAEERERADLQAQFLQMGGFGRLLELQRRVTELEGRGEQVPEEIQTEFEEFRAELLEVWQRIQAYGR